MPWQGADAGDHNVERDESLDMGAILAATQLTPPGMMLSSADEEACNEIGGSNANLALLCDDSPIEHAETNDALCLRIASGGLGDTAGTGITSKSGDVEKAAPEPQLDHRESTDAFRDGERGNCCDGKVTWLWHHKRTETYRRYREAEAERIEKAYRRGCSMVRLKGGKTGSLPMEVWFTGRHMFQYNPESNNTRRIQRKGPNIKLRRIWAEIFFALETGRPWRETQHQYEYGEVREEQLYKDGSFCTKLVTHHHFLYITVVAILLNALWIVIDADSSSLSDKTIPAYAKVIECIFCLFFCVEISLRIGAVRKWQECLFQNSIRLDSFLAIVMLVETIVMLLLTEKTRIGSLDVFRIARILRITRLGRFAKLLRLVPELAMLVKGIFAAVRSVFFTLVLLFVLLFIFAVIFKEQSAETTELNEALFPTLPAAVWNLLLFGLLDDPAGTIEMIYEHSTPLAFLFVFFVFLTSYTVLNLLAGILFDVVVGVKKAEDERAVVADLRREILDIIDVFDKNDNDEIHMNEIDLLLGNKQLKKILTRAGVDVYQVKMLCLHIIDNDEEASVSFEEFIKVVLALHNTNQNDLIVDLRHYVRQRFDTIEYNLFGARSPAAQTFARKQISQTLRKAAEETRQETRQEICQETLNEVPVYVKAALSSLEKYASSEEGAKEAHQFHLGVAVLQEWGQERLQRSQAAGN